ncbi:MAG: mannitol dehydrogenase family protein [Polaromonas sp.]|nr:mannitol dehydrogenase family protein [Polaromonas sp.]
MEQRGLVPKNGAMQQLNQAALPALAERGIAVPDPDRRAQGIGVVHLGLGAFHRAHQAMVFDQLMRQRAGRWGVFGVAMRSTWLADALAQQHGLYSVQVNSREGRSWQVVGALLDTCVAAREAARVIAMIAAPSTRWVTLTVTEKGYGPGLAALLVQGLAARREAGGAGLTIASCDNLTGNGGKLRKLCIERAAQESGALAGWISQACAFPDSMVDRIVPAATPERLQEAADALGVADACALGTECFWEWVIENRFADPRDGQALASVGVKVVADVRPFEQAKLHMLNGSHTAMACIGAVLGLPTICDCVTQPDIGQFVHGLMTDEIMPHLSRPDVAGYRDALLARFANPALKHSVHQIATDNSQKIPQRWPPSVSAQLAAGGAVEHLALAAAAWMRYCLGEDEQGDPYLLSDPLATALQASALQHRGDAPATVQALLGIGDIWGAGLPQDSRWTSRVTHWLGRIHAVGLLAAVREVNRAASPG